jgi:TnpA family transposase
VSLHQKQLFQHVIQQSMRLVAYSLAANIAALVLELYSATIGNTSYSPFVYHINVRNTDTSVSSAILYLSRIERSVFRYFSKNVRSIHSGITMV